MYNVRKLMLLEAFTAAAMYVLNDKSEEIFLGDQQKQVKRDDIVNFLDQLDYSEVIDRMIGHCNDLYIEKGYKNMTEEDAFKLIRGY